MSLRLCRARCRHHASTVSSCPPAIVWQYRAGRGGLLGGIEWGSAVDGERAYFAVSDVTHPQPGGLHAVTLVTGTAAWAAAPPALACAAGRGCSAAQSSALTVIPGAVFSGAFDGALRAYSAATGDVIWSFDSNRTFTTVNSVPAAGASIGGPGPAIAGGMVFVNSGYGAFRAARATCCWRSASIRAGRAGKAGRVGRELLAALEALTLGRFRGHLKEGQNASRSPDGPAPPR